MLKINKKYRRLYAGEDIIVERTYEGGEWNTTVENVPNAVINSQISNQAVILGNGPSRLDFDLTLIKEHKGGLLGASTLQTYGCNALYRDFAPNFLVASGNTMVSEIAGSSYVTDNIVYTNSLNMLEHPGKFYLIPYDPYADAGTTAAYIAAFDGHRKIFLMGFDGQDTENYNYNVYAGTNGYDATDATVSGDRWKANFRQLAQVYNDVEFVFVHKTAWPVATEWRDLVNVRSVSYRDFVLEANL